MQTGVIQRSIEELVRSANRDAVNPHLMPDDAIACYDSSVTEFAAVMSVLNSLSDTVNLNLDSADFLKALLGRRASLRNSSRRGLFTLIGIPRRSASVGGRLATGRSPMNGRARPPPSAAPRAFRPQ
jgi:hypothetical protein